MARWTRRTKGWLNNYRPKKESFSNETKPPGRPQKSDEEYAIIFVPIKCPKCGSKNVRCYKSDPPIRYHKCRDCKKLFKSIEK